MRQHWPLHYSPQMYNYEVIKICIQAYLVFLTYINRIYILFRTIINVNSDIKSYGKPNPQMGGMFISFPGLKV